MKKFLSLVTITVLISLGAVTVAQMQELAPEEHLTIAEHDALGSYLADSQGRTLYIVVDDDDQRVECTGECADAWPPFTLESIEGMMADDMMGEAMSDDAMAMGTIDPELVGTVARRDGTTHVTYGGHPLYYFVGDEEPGEVNCQAVENFGGTWYVIAPSGDIVKTAL